MRGDGLGDDIDGVGAELRRAVVRLYSRFRSERVEGEVSEASLLVLVVLDRQGPLSLSDLSSFAKVTLGSMSQTVRRLVQQEYVTRSRGTQDRRKVLFTLTDQGRDVSAPSRRHRQDWLNDRFAELTATERTGQQRYTYPAGSGAENVLIEVGRSNGSTYAGDVHVVGDDTVEGWLQGGNFCGETGKERYRIFFSATFDRTFASFGTWTDDTLTANKRDAPRGSSRAGAWVTFDPAKGGRVGASSAVLRALRTLFTDDPYGMPGNDDLGATSSLLVFAMAGVFEPQPGSAAYVISAPMFDKVEIRPAHGRTIRIEAPGADASKLQYVSSVRTDRGALNRSWLSHGDLLRSGTIRVGLSDRPSDWGVDAAPPALAQD